LSLQKALLHVLVCHSLCGTHDADTTQLTAAAAAAAAAAITATRHPNMRSTQQLALPWLALNITLYTELQRGTLTVARDAASGASGTASAAVRADAASFGPHKRADWAGGAVRTSAGV
jgi:hypothetical protein